jgi:hypothetical protein
MFDCIGTNDNIGGVLVSVLASSVVYLEFEPRSCQTRDYKIDMCCFSATNAAQDATQRSKIKDGLSWYQDNVS